MSKHLAGIFMLLLACSTGALQAQFIRQSSESRQTKAGDAKHALEIPDAPLPHGSFVLMPDQEAGVLPVAPAKLGMDREYDLPALINIAESANPAAQIARENARNAALGVHTVASTYLPVITASALGAYQGENGQNGALGTTIHNAGNALGNVEAVSLEWLLFDFGGRKSFVAAAKKLDTASDVLSVGVHQQIAYGVSLAYYSYIAAEQRRSAVAESMGNAQEIERAAEERYAHGQGTVVEVAQGRDLVAQTQLSLVTAQGDEQQAYATLLTAIGVSPLITIRIAPLVRRPLPAADSASIDVIVRAALARRPDVLAAYNGVLASQASVKAAEAQDRPKIFLAATGAYVSGQLGITAVPPIGEQLPTLNITNSQWNGTILLGASVPIFDGHRRANAIRQAKNDEDKAASTLTQVRLNALRDIVSAQIALRNDIAANRAAASLKSTAQILYDSTLDAYRQGVGTVTASAEAENHLFQANLTEENAYTSALSAAARLALAMGTLESSSQ